MDSVNLPKFEDGGLWQNPFAIGDGWRHFRVGTCAGAYRHTREAYEVLAINNDQPGNGHVEATFSWFIICCKRNKCDFIIKEVINTSLAAKLARLGFTCKIKNDYILHYKDM